MPASWEYEPARVNQALFVPNGFFRVRSETVYAQERELQFNVWTVQETANLRGQRIIKAIHPQSENWYMVAHLSRSGRPLWTGRSGVILTERQKDLIEAGLLVCLLTQRRPETFSFNELVSDGISYVPSEILSVITPEEPSVTIPGPYQGVTYTVRCQRTCYSCNSSLHNQNTTGHCDDPECEPNETAQRLTPRERRREPEESEIPKCRLHGGQCQHVL